MIGRYPHRVIVQRLTKMPDDGGGYFSSWVNVDQLRAMVAPLSGAELLQAQRLNNQITHRILTKYTKNLSESDRILWNGRTFNIVSLLNVQERNRELILTAVEGDMQFEESSQS